TNSKFLPNRNSFEPCDLLLREIHSQFWKLKGAQIETDLDLRRGAMKIQQLSLICAAFGLSLPEIPDLPDVVEIVENAIHGNFTAQTVEEPKEFLPTIAEIRTMTDQERGDRFHWFLCVFLLVFLCVVISGTVIMVVGAELKARGSYQALGHTTPLSKGAQLRLVMLSFGSTVLLSFAACLWSLQTGRLSKTFGLAWEIYLLLFCRAGASLLVQAVLAVAWLNRGDRFDATAFAVASFSSMAPFLSDQSVALTFSLFKPVRAAAIPALGKRLSRAMKSGNTVAAKALWEEAEIEGDRQLFAEILPHLTFFLDVTKHCGFMSEELKDLDMLSHEELDALQCMAAVFAGKTECGLDHRKIGDSGAKVVAEALKTTTTEELVLNNNDIGEQGAEALAESLKSNKRLKGLWLENNKIGDRGAEALAEGLKSNGSLGWLELQNNNIGDRGAEALAETLASTGSLGWLELEDNNIGDCGAEALAESLKSNGSLRWLFLNSNNFGDCGAEALAAGLLQNRSLWRLSLSEFGSNLWGPWPPGFQALEEAEKIKQERGDDFEIWWM
ncbi:unnamed protein product, partial [Cladocopium goreaui]